MMPEEMDVIELTGDIALLPAWVLKPGSALSSLPAGTRGMIVHCEPDGTRYDIEFLDGASQEPVALVPLQSSHFRVVERYSMEGL